MGLICKYGTSWARVKNLGRLNKRSSGFGRTLRSKKISHAREVTVNSSDYTIINVSFVKQKVNSSETNSSLKFV